MDPEEAETIQVLTRELAAIMLSIVAIVSTYFQSRKATKVAEKAATSAKNAEEQVTNNHESNLRDDVTSLMTSIDSIKDATLDTAERMERIETRQRKLAEGVSDISDSLIQHKEEATKSYKHITDKLDAHEAMTDPLLEWVNSRGVIDWVDAQRKL